MYSPDSCFPSSFYFQSSSQTAIFCIFTLKTQPCTIQSSKSLLLQPQLKIVYPKPHFSPPRPRFLLVLFFFFFKDRERSAEVRRIDQQFTKLDSNKSNNNNNKDNNLKSDIFCLCSILLIHINRGIFHTTCTGLDIQKIGMYRSNHRKVGREGWGVGGHISGVSCPEVHLCAHSSDLYKG